MFQHFNLWSHLTVLKNVTEVLGLSRAEARELVGEVLRIMQRLAEEGKTMVVVTHEMEFARHVPNHVIFLQQGLIEEQGLHSELFGNPKCQRLQQCLSGV